MDEFAVMAKAAAPGSCATSKGCTERFPVEVTLGDPFLVPFCARKVTSATAGVPSVGGALGFISRNQGLIILVREICKRLVFSFYLPIFTQRAQREMSVYLFCNILTSKMLIIL